MLGFLLHVREVGHGGLHAEGHLILGNARGDLRVDAVFGDRALLLEARARALDPAALKVLGNKYSYEPYALALRRDDNAFRQAVDAALARLYRTDQIVKIHELWFGPVGDDPETAALYRLLGLPD